MIILNVNKVSKSYGFGELLKEISFSVNDGEKIAIVGENGCGKSTLLKMIAGIETCKDGLITIKKNAIVEYLEQGDNADIKQGVCKDILNSAFDHLKDLKQELEDYEDMY